MKPKVKLDLNDFKDENEFKEFSVEEWTQRSEMINNWDDSWDQTIEDMSSPEDQILRHICEQTLQSIQQ